MTKRNDKINCGAVMRATSALQSLEHASSHFIIPSATEPLYRENPGSMNNVLNEYRLKSARPHYVLVIGSEGFAARTAVFYSTYFAQKRLQDTTGKANVDHAVEEQEEVVRAFERRQERRERKECVEETLLEDVSETRSLSLQFWKLQEFTEQLSSLSLSLNTFKLLKEIVREYKGIGECEGKGGNPQETRGVVLCQSPPVCCSEKPSIEIAAGITHQIQIQHVTSNRNNQPVPVWGARPCGAKDTSGYPHNVRLPRDLAAADLINQASDEVEGIRTCVGICRPLEACGDLQGVGTCFVPSQPPSNPPTTSTARLRASWRRWRDVRSVDGPHSCCVLNVNPRAVIDGSNPMETKYEFTCSCHGEGTERHVVCISSNHLAHAGCWQAAGADHHWKLCALANRND